MCLYYHIMIQFCTTKTNARENEFDQVCVSTGVYYDLLYVFNRYILCLYNNLTVANCVIYFHRKFNCNVILIQ